ncbi:hypothetical protein ABW636_06195 [Aquimarina sp. 2201CG1-2-11]|uniref:hypothetical protein n=1 Tax=Aquimarina discodermiae TaxID=3231043 RepID=UPI0034619B8A
MSFICAQENDSWILGTGINIVDNSGSQFKELINIEENWNISRLLKITMEKRFKYDYGIEASFTLNEFLKKKKINSELNTQNRNYYAIDIMLKNYVSNYWKDPRHAKNIMYIIGGWGGNFFNGGINNSFNIGIGINFKTSYKTSLNLQTLGKFSIDNNTPGNANHLQHSVSFIFQLWENSYRKSYKKSIANTTF